MKITFFFHNKYTNSTLEIWKNQSIPSSPYSLAYVIDDDDNNLKRQIQTG